MLRRKKDEIQPEGKHVASFLPDYVNGPSDIMPEPEGHHITPVKNQSTSSRWASNPHSLPVTGCPGFEEAYKTTAEKSRDILCPVTSQQRSVLDRWIAPWPTHRSNRSGRHDLFYSGTSPSCEHLRHIGAQRTGAWMQ